MNDFTVDVSDVSNAVLLRLAGEIRTDVSALDRRVTQLLARRPAVVVIDLAGVTFCSSLGMGSIMALKRDMDRLHCKVKLSAVQPLVLESFKRARVSDIFQIYANSDEALLNPV